MSLTASKHIAPKAKSTKAKGPVLTWTPARDVAIVTAIRKGGARNAAEIIAAVKDDEAFEGVIDALHEHKVRIRLSKLRAKGVKIPEFRRQFYQADVDALNKI